MKLPLIFLTAFLGTIPVLAQDPLSGGWKTLPLPSLEEVAAQANGIPTADVPSPSSAPSPAMTSRGALGPLVPPTPTPGGNVADEITPEISELARGLRYDPVLIYEFVRNRVDFDPYYGCKKGAHLTLMEMSENDMDQSALLVALLRASGYAPSYRSGAVAFSVAQHLLWHGMSSSPYSDLTDPQFAQQIGTTASDPDLPNLRMYHGLTYYLTGFGYPIVQRVGTGSGSLYGIPHIWVQVAVNGTTYQLSPSFKQYDWLPGIDLAAATGYSKSQLLSDASPEWQSDSNGTTWVGNVDYAKIANRLGSYTTNFLNHIRDNHDLKPAEEIFPSRRLIRKPIATLADAEPLTVYTDSWATPETWTSTTIPVSRMSKVHITAGTYEGGTFTTTRFDLTDPLPLPALKGRKLSLAFSGNTATFRLDETPLQGAFTLPASTVQVRLAVTHDIYKLTASGGSFTKTDTDRANQTVVQTYAKSNNNAYAFPYAFSDPRKQLRDRQEILERYKRDGIPDNDWRVRTEVLNVIGLEWYSQSWRAHRMVTALDGGASLFQHRIGRVGQEANYYIDIVGQMTSSQHRGQALAHTRNIDRVSAMFMSAMEHGVLEQLQPGSTAASTVEVIYQANKDFRICRATAANWPQLRWTFYNDLPSIEAAVNAGAVALMPVTGRINIGDWWGEGFVLEHPALTEMKIERRLNGGYSVFPGTAGSATVILWGNTSPSHSSSAGNVLNLPYTPHTTPQMASADPVDLLSGAFFIDRTDLDLSGHSVLGLSFSRHYNSHRRHDNSGGLGHGWTHNHHVRLAERSSTGALLGETNSYQMAPLVVAALAGGGLHFEHTTAKEWVSSCLAVRWGIECLKNTAAAITIGNRTLEFIRMPGGTYTAPPGVKMSLEKNTDGTWQLTERHGDTFLFDATGKLTSITNTSGKQKTFAYSGDKLATVTDAFGRTLTYTWAGDEIASVSDGTRSVSFGYTAGNLTAATDAENQTWTYRYDADRRMDQTRDPADRVLIENDYDTRNRVKTQRAKGDPDRTWNFTWSGFLNVEENPYGELTAYLYDHRGRIETVTNPLGETSLTAYDGQDRIHTTMTPEGEISYSAWNADHNLVGTIDPRGEITGHFYDAELRLQRTRDRRGKDTTFTYTPSHLLESVTDPLGHTTHHHHNAYGLLEKIVDAAGKVTETTYDIHGSPSEISVRPSPSGPPATVKTFVNDPIGNVLTESDGAGRTITHTWNGRRQLLTRSLAVAGGATAVTTHTYDPAGNLATTTDANGHTTTFESDQLANPVKTTLPALPAGNHEIVTGYDLRDWPVSTADSLSRVTSTEYDAAGRITALIDPLSRRTEVLHDANGRPLETKDPLDRITKRNWTVRGENSRQTDGLGKHTDFTFDPNGNPTHRTDRRGKTYLTAFDDASRPVSVTTPAGRTTSTTYHANHQVATITEPSGQTTGFTYNARNQIETRSDPTGTTSYQYESGGLLHTVTEGAAVITRTYDARGRLETYTRTVDGTVQSTLGYQWDANGNLTRLTYPDGRHVHYTWNARNLLHTVTDWANRQTVYHYDRAGRLAGIDRPYNQTATTFTRDAADRIREIRESRDGALFSYLNFTHDAAGQITSRLQAPLMRPSVWHHPQIAATYDDDNRLATLNGQPVAHDPDGNLTSGPLQGSAGVPPASSPPWQTLTYNSRNQLTSAAGITYTYDSEGHRLTATGPAGTTRYLHDPSAALSRLLVKIAPDGSQTHYVHGLGLLYEVGEDGATKTHHFDQTGSTIARTGDDGQVIARASYSAYGLPVLRHGDLDTPFLYNGQAGVITDPNGLLHMRARYYSPYLMRFLNADPIGFSGGSNWFAYADGNPISLSDPFGLCAESSQGIWGSLKSFGNAASGAWYDAGQAYLGIMDRVMYDLEYTLAFALGAPVELADMALRGMNTGYSMNDVAGALGPLAGRGIVAAQEFGAAVSHRAKSIFRQGLESLHRMLHLPVSLADRIADFLDHVVRLPLTRKIVV